MHYQQLENYKQNVDVALPMKKFLRTHMTITELLRLAMN